jgi:uncharacterized protein
MERVNAILNNPIYIANLKIIEESEKKRIFCKHDLEHFLNVARIMKIKALEDNLPIATSIIYATSFLHDLGRSIQYTLGEDHAKASARLAREILPTCNFTFEEIELIAFAIQNHNSKDSNEPLAKLLCYADKISRNCFICPAKKACNWPENKKNKGVTI